MDKHFYIENRKRLLNKISSDEIILLFGSSAPYKNSKGYYGKQLDMNFFYMTGLEKSSYIIAMWKENGKCYERLFMEERIPYEEKWSGIRMSTDEAKDICGVDDINYLSNFDEFVNDMLSNTNYSLNLDIPSWYEFDVPPSIQTFINRINNNFISTKINNIKPIINDMRIVKSAEEIECIKKGIANAKLGIDAMLKKVHPHMYEYQLKAIAHNCLYESGEMQASPMVATGGNAAILHYPKSTAEIKENDLVLIDFCPRNNHYASDISRAFPANGKFSKRQNEFYSIALDANKKMIDVVKAGMSFVEMNQICRQFLGKSMMSIGLIDRQEDVEKYYFHSVSHYIGLDIHDVGNVDIPLQENSVLTIDAGVYVAEEGIGLRVEDNVLIKKNSSINLSSSIIKEIADIEEFMK